MHQFDLYQRFALKTVNTVVFSETMRQQVLRIVPQKENLYQHYPGVGEQYYLNSDAGDSQEGPCKAKKTLLFVGRLAQVKNLRMMIRAFAKVSFRDTRLVLVGSGEEEEVLNSLVHELGLDERVFLVGTSRECEEHYRNAHYSVLTSFYESYGNVIAESLVCGTPLIAFSSDLPEIMTATNELIQDGDNGFLCTEFTIDALAETIERALAFSDTDEYTQMRERCKQNALEKFSWEKFLKFCLNILPKNDGR